MTDLRIDLQWDDVQLIKRAEATEKQMVFGVVNGLRNAALRLQQSQFGLVRGEFMIRKPEFFFGTTARPGGAAARITAFPSVPRAKVPKGRLYAEISMSPSSQASQRRTLLPLFQTGGKRTPMTPGAKHVAVPLLGRPARPSVARGVPPQFTFAGLKFAAYSGGKRLKRKRQSGKEVDVGLVGEFGRVALPELGGRSRVQWKGQQRTFILTKTQKAPLGGVFQRIGPERGDIRMVYKFVDPFDLERRLHWLENAQRMGPTFLHDEIEKQAVDIVVHNAGKVPL